LEGEKPLGERVLFQREEWRNLQTKKKGGEGRGWGARKKRFVRQLFLKKMFKTMKHLK